MTVSDDLAQMRIEGDLREALDRTLRQLDKAKASRDELVAAVYRAAGDAAASVKVPPVPKPPRDRRTADPETAICLLGDWQLGKRTPSYDSGVAAERIRRYAAKVVKLIELQRTHHPVREARVYLLGDLIEGELIFPGQAHRIDASLYRQLFEGASLLAEVVRTIASAVERVRVVGVIGNHGALGGSHRRDMHPESNADAMMYNIARLSVSDPRVDWQETLVSDERAWVALDEVQGKRWLLFHGDQVKGASLGFPWYGFGKRLLGWYSAVGPYHFAASGHWHVPVRWGVNTVTHWSSGSPESANTFAQEFLASGSQEPSQWLIFQGANGPTAEYSVRLG